MAENYKITEAIKIFSEGTDYDKIKELFKRYPMASYHLVKLGECASLIADAFYGKTDNLRKMENAYRANLFGEGDDADDEAGEDDEAESKKAKKPASKYDEMDPAPWSEMSQYQKKKARELGKDFVAKCKALDEDDDEEEPEEKAPKKSAKKVAKKPVVDEDDDDDEILDADEDDDDDEPEEKPSKKAKKEKKSTKKAKKVEEDDDDDFDFD